MTGLGEMGIATWINKVYPLGRIAHCIAATIATLASHPHCAAVLMANNEQHGVVATLMLLCAVHVCPPFTPVMLLRTVHVCPVFTPVCPSSRELLLRPLSNFSLLPAA